MVDIGKIRVGDEVTVTFSGRVVSVFADTFVVDGDRSIKTDANNHRHVPKSLVTSCLSAATAPREIEVGDRVYILGYSQLWSVEALSGQRAWITDNGANHVVAVANLRLAT